MQGSNVEQSSHNHFLSPSIKGAHDRVGSTCPLLDQYPSYQALCFEFQYPCSC
uniref:Uncharacterized protein n=1 Tax=Rhizophora mucronata TaxID=61149 RepID=A0A2P2NMX1_RHIMU